VVYHFDITPGGRIEGNGAGHVSARYAVSGHFREDFSNIGAALFARLALDNSGLS